ncbi:hypothetical protein [Halobacillus sp. BBL2006]|uniref:hypothetical protein n=1 Tax=Halobacillus sp. BBL2006 TaxID=1543706 RepID=UPI0005432E16|nr:hypothetical protein [Halobacillus sp. BBL2006]KHE72346.1 hypothetical protein LD39_05010 [Halobacillus sp. BBL2006]
MKWLEVYFKKKDLKLKAWKFRDHNGAWHTITNHQTIEIILACTSEDEQQEIGKIIRRIDLENGDIEHFLEHLAKGIVLETSRTIEQAGMANRLKIKEYGKIRRHEIETRN